MIPSQWLVIEAFLQGAWGSDLSVRPAGRLSALSSRAPKWKSHRRGRVGAAVELGEHQVGLQRRGSPASRPHSPRLGPH